MNRLETAMAMSFRKECFIETYVPPTHRPNVRTNRSKPNEMDVYGLRPLSFPWKYLSPLEFTMNWRAEPLLIPSYYENRNEWCRTRWTAKGQALMSDPAYRDGKKIAKPG